MKKVILILCLFLLMGCKTKKAIAKPTGENIGLNAIDEAQKNKAYELGKRVLITCITHKFTPFTASEATDKVIANTTLARLKKTCVKFTQKYGAFKDLRFIERIPNQTDKTNVYRFKADFENKTANKELRVTMNQENKVTAITSKDWTDAFE
jgi:hypothetical protein